MKQYQDNCYGRGDHDDDESDEDADDDQTAQFGSYDRSRIPVHDLGLTGVSPINCFHKNCAYFNCIGYLIIKLDVH